MIAAITKRNIGKYMLYLVVNVLLNAEPRGLEG